MSEPVSDTILGDDLKKKRGPGPLFFQIIPFFMSSFFFLSALFSLFAPLPLLLFYLRTSLTWLSLAVVSNTVLVGVLGGIWSAILFFALVGAPSLLIAFGFIRKRMSIEKTIGLNLLLIALVGGGLVYYGITHPAQPWVIATQHTFAQITEQVHTLAQKNGGEWLDVTLKEFQEQVVSELPSSIAIVVLIMSWVNISLLLSLNPRNVRKMLGIDARYFKRWRAPFALVWPTMAFGALAIWGQGWVGDSAMGALKFFLTIYALQGLAIMAFFMDRFKILGIFRSLFYLLALMLMLPLVLGIGFFDLWFDFRSKFRQT